MIPKVIEGATHVLGAPEEWDPVKQGRCARLHVRKIDGCVMSAWEPTPAELAMLVAGGSVILGVAGQVMPPVYLTVVPAT